LKISTQIKIFLHRRRLKMSGIRKTINRHWTYEDVCKLIDSYQAQGCRPKWVQILAANPKDFKGFDANELGNKGRKIGLTDCHNAEDCKKLKLLLKDKSMKNLPLSCFPKTMQGSNQIGCSSSVMAQPSDDFDDDDNIVSDAVDLDDNSDEGIIATPSLATHSPNGPKKPQQINASNIEKNTFIPSSTEMQLANSGILMPPYVVDRETTMLLVFLRIAGVIVDVTFPSNYQVAIVVTIPSLPDEMCAELLTLEPTMNVTEVQRKHDKEKIFTAALTTRQVISLPFEIVPALSRLTTSANLFGIFIQKKESIKLTMQKALAFRKQDDQNTTDS